MCDEADVSCAVTNISEMGAGVIGGTLVWNVTAPSGLFQHFALPRYGAATVLRPTLCRAVRQLSVFNLDSKARIGAPCLSTVNRYLKAGNIGSSVWVVLPD